MVDLLLILFPAILLIAGIGWWLIKDMTTKNRTIGKFLLMIFALVVAGIVVLAFFGGIGVILTALTITGYKLYKRRPQ